MTKNIVIGDADSLIALLVDTDANHARVLNTLSRLNSLDISVIYPNTVIAEAITALLRKHSNQELAGYLSQQYKENVFRIEYIDEEIMKLAVELFDTSTSKQNTFFDAIVAACTKKLAAAGIFSFDAWYPKIGFTLAEDLK